MSYRNIRLRNQLNDLMQSKKLTDIKLKSSITNQFERMLSSPTSWAKAVIEVDEDISEGIEVELSESEEEKFVADYLEFFGEYPEKEWFE